MRILVALIVFAGFAVGSGSPFELKPEHVGIIYNEESPDGRALAEAYAKLRKIPDENIIALNCPQEEVISREDYNRTIREPLRHAALARKWWVPSGNPSEPMLSRKIFVLALMKGIPLKIQTDPAVGKSGVATDAASVDSELAMLGMEGVPTPGMMVNAYFEKDEEFVGSGFPYFLATRLDAPNREICLSMMYDAVDVEKKGLWGWLVVDKGGPFPQGNQWMENIAERGEGAGIPLILDDWVQTLPSHYPLGNDTALYFGWYAGQANGPFLSQSFRFKPGAIAVHLHSFSAFSVRTTEKFWVGPLLARGAAVTLGNVFEPYLDTSAHLDLFFDRLASGYTVAEAAGMSMRVWSWQNVVFGDPLYRPFARQKEKKIVKSEADKYFQAWYLASRNWGENPEKFERKIDEAARQSSASLFFLEALGNRAMQKKDWQSASAYFSKALVSAAGSKDRIRLRMSQAEVWRRKGDKKRCLEELNALAGLYPATEWTPAFVEWKNRLQPPPPPPNPKPKAQAENQKKKPASAVKR